MTWIQTYTNKKFDLVNPSIDDITIIDIAHALSNLCRFTGHLNAYYSVAQHSVIVSKWVSQKNALWGLLHDSAEAYLGDVSRPLKRLLPYYNQLEGNLLGVIAEKFGLKPIIPKEVKKRDTSLLLREAQLFLGPPPEIWRMDEYPMVIDITPLPPQEAKQEFLERFDKLTKGEQPCP